MSEIPYRRYDVRNSPEPLPENVVIIDTPTTEFRIAYGIHVVEQDPGDVVGSDAIVLEGIMRADSIESLEHRFETLREHRQYKEVVAEAEQSQTPIFIVDAPVATQYVAALQTILKAVEIGTAFELVRRLVRDVSTSELSEKNSDSMPVAEPTSTKSGGMSRRNFLKRSLQFGAATYLGSHVPEIASVASGGILDESDPRRAVQRFLTELNDDIHPETNLAITRFRNLLFAHKATLIGTWLNSEKNHPQVSMILGALHTGIEKDLVRDDLERSSLLEELLSVDGLEEFRNQCSKIGRFDYFPKHNRWLMTYTADPLFSKPTGFSGELQ